MEGMRSEPYYGKRGVWSDRLEGVVVMELVEVVMVVGVLSISAKALIAGCRSCGGWGITFSTFSCVVVT